MTIQFSAKGAFGLSWRWLAIAAVALGLWVSFRYAFATWQGDADTSTPAMLWQGMQQHGLGFIRTFRFTPDSWLLWPLPLFFAAFAVFGTSPAVVIALGWALFAGCVAMAALVTRKVAGWVPAAAVAIVLLLSNRSALGGMGLFTYPLTHNASLLAGLFALWAALKWLQAGRWIWLALCGASLALAGASDPWTQAAVTVPLGIAGAWLAWRRRREAPRPGLALWATAVAAFIAAHTHLFGLLGFVPDQPIEFVREGRHLHAWYLLKLLAMWFNVVPGQEHVGTMLPTGVVLADTAVLLAAALGALAMGRRLVGDDDRFDLLWATGAASCVITAAAFVLLVFGLGPEMGRYFMATYVFAVMLFASATARAWAWLGRPARSVIVLLSLALPVNGLASGPGVWSSTAAPAGSPQALQIAQMLRDHGLTYGYGQYWDSQANTVTWLTHGAVTIRPVGFDSNTGDMRSREAEVSSLWYTPPDRPAGQGSTFLIIGQRNTADSDGCTDPARCEASAERAFGTPRQRFTYGGSLVMVWDHPLFGMSSQARAATVAPTPVGSDIDLTTGGRGGYLLAQGWSQPEPIGTWTDATKATLLLRLPPGVKGPLKLTLQAGAFAPPPVKVQSVSVSMAGKALATWSVLPGDPRPYSVVIPAQFLTTGSGVIELSIPGAISPVAAKVSGDTRRLGVNVRSLRLDPAP